MVLSQILPCWCYKDAFKLGLEQVKSLIDCDATDAIWVQHVMKIATYAHQALVQEQTTTNATIRQAPVPVPNSSQKQCAIFDPRAISDPTLVWGTGEDTSLRKPIMDVKKAALYCRIHSVPRMSLTSSKTCGPISRRKDSNVCEPQSSYWLNFGFLHFANRAQRNHSISC